MEIKFISLFLFAAKFHKTNCVELTCQLEVEVSLLLLVNKLDEYPLFR